MFLELKYAYLGLCAPFIFIWLLFFLLSPATRKDQLFFSALKIPFGPAIDILYLTDYWSPESILFLQLDQTKIMIESSLFAFFFGGIASIAYRALFKSQEKELPRPDTKRTLLHYGTFFATTTAFLLVGINSIFATAIGYGTSGFFMVARKESSFYGAVFTSIFITGILFAVYFFGRLFVINSEIILQHWWLLYATELDIRFANVPLTEMAWVVCYGFTTGARYNPLPKKTEQKYLINPV